MNGLAALALPPLAGGLLGVLALALLLRWLHRGEQRSQGVALLLATLALVAVAVAWRTPGAEGVGQAATAAAVLLGGLAGLQVAASLLFRVLLPLAHRAVPRIVHDLAVAALSLGWVFAWLHLWGMNPAQLFTTSALVTAVLAFSMQDTLGNVLGGVVVQVDDSLRVGDWVRMDDTSGRVDDVGWRSTTLLLRNGERTVVPNSWLMKNRFNVVRPSQEGALPAVRRAVVLPVRWEGEPSRVIEALERAVADADIPDVLAEPRPSALLSETGAGFHRYTLRYWLSAPQHDDPADSAVRIHALAALERAGFALGLPQEEHLTIKENDSWRSSVRQREQARRLAAIQRTEIFAGLPLAEQEALASHLVHAPFVAGDVMTRQGAVAHWLYLIVSGRARVTVDTPQGKVDLGELADGSVFGEMGMLTGDPRSATVTATTAVDCYRLDKVGFAEVLRSRPEVAREISSIVEARQAARVALAGSAGAAQEVPLLERIRRFFSLYA